MSTSNNDTLPFVALEAINEGDAVKFGSGGVEQCDAVTDIPAGISLTTVSAADATAGKKVTVQMSGRVEKVNVDATAAIAAGDYLRPSTTAGVLAKNTGTSTHVYAARAVSALASGTGQIRAIILQGGRAA